MKFQLPEQYQENNPNILVRVREDFSKEKPFNYLFTGQVGSGKTFLAEIIVRLNEARTGRWERTNCRNVYKTYLRLLDSNYTDKSDAIQKHEDIVKKTFVFMDDLGDERPSTEGSHDYVGCMLVERCETVRRSAQASSIITTNLKMQEIIEMYGSRVVDRLEEHFTIMKFKDHSFRRDKREIIKG